MYAKLEPGLPISGVDKEEQQQLLPAPGQGCDRRQLAPRGRHPVSRGRSFFSFSHHLVRFSSSRCGVCGYSSQRAGGNGADKECGVRPYGAKLERALIVLGMKFSAPVGLSIKAITSLSLCYLAALFVSACIMPRIARRGEKRSVRFFIYYVWHQGSDGQFRAA